MSFERIRDDLQVLEARLAQSQPITAEDVFNTIRDLCDDIRSDTGAAVEQQPAGDVAALLRQMPWLGRLISRQYRRIEGQVADLGRREQLDGKMRELEELTERLEFLSGETEALETQHKKLLQTRQQLQSQSEKKQLLQNACQTLEQQNRQLASVTVPQLQDKQLRLQLENDQLSAECLRLRQQLEQDRQQEQGLKDDLESLRTDIKNTGERCESCRRGIARLQEEKDRLAQLQEQAGQQLEQLEAQTEDARVAWRICSEQQLPQAQELLQAQRSARDEQLLLLQAARLEAEELRKQVDSTQAEQTQLRQQALGLGSQLEKLRRDKQDKLQQLEQLRQALGEFDNECARLQKQLDQLGDDLAGKDREQMKQNLEEAIDRRTRALNQYHEMEIRLQEQQQLIREQEQKNRAADEQHQELKRQAERDNQKASERITRLQQQIGELKSRSDQLSAEESALKKQTEQLEGWLRGLELEQYTQRLERMRQRNQELAEMKDALQKDLQRLMAAGNLSASELDTGLFQADFRNMEGWILHYQKLFADTVSKLGTKEVL